MENGLDIGLDRELEARVVAGLTEMVARATLLDVPSLMQRLSIGRSSVFELIASGDLSSVKVAGRRLVALADVDAYLQRRRSAPTSIASSSDGAL